MTDLTPEQKKELRDERRRLISQINSYIRIMRFQSDEQNDELAVKAERILEIEKLINYRPRKARLK